MDVVFESELTDGILKINCLDSIFGFSLEDSDTIMATVIDKILEFRKVERIILAERREYEYDYDQTKLLVEIANLYDKLLNQERILDEIGIGTTGYSTIILNGISELKFVLQETLRRDPIGAYVKLKRMIRRYESKSASAQNRTEKLMYNIFIKKYLLPIKDSLEKTQLINMVKEELYGYSVGDRNLYRKIFSPMIRPLFMLTRYISLPPKNSRLVERYSISDEIQVEVFRVPDKVRYFYFVNAPEFRLDDEKYFILDAARRQLAEHKPTGTEFTQPERVREIFTNIGKDMILQLAGGRKFTIKEIKEMTDILVRYTTGFGVLEILLNDDKLQDIYINSPIGTTPIYVHHDDYEECETNLIPTREDAESWATRFRLFSGRPLDEANPVLDTELLVPGGRARVAAITRTLSPEGIAYALRRHRDKPWTYPLFVNAKYCTPLYAGLMSFIVDGSRSILFAGGRSSGKSSMLGATMLEIMKKFRLITVEDTLELPVPQLRNIGYNIERMKSRSVITRIESELPADEALRTALRLGDSCLIVGEVRSSIRGDEEVLVIENGITKRIKIKDIEGKNIENYLVPTLDFDLKMKYRKLSGFVKHPKRDKLIKITTKTGREVTVTPDHSLFTSTRDFRIASIVCDNLKVGDQIVIPSKLPYGFNDVDEINLLELLPNLRLQNYENILRKAIKKIGWKYATEIAEISSGDIYNYFRYQKTYIPIQSFKNIMSIADIEYLPEELIVRKGTSKTLPAVIPVNEDFCRFLGYFVSEGYYSLKDNEGGKVIITNSDEKIINDINDISKKIFNLHPDIRSTKGWGKSKQMQFFCLSLAALLSKLGCGRTSEEKRIPPIIFGLSKKKISAFLRGLYSGDGNFTKSERSGNCIRYFTTSKKLAEDVMYLLMVFGIVGRITSKKTGKNKKTLWVVEFKDRKMVKTFLDEIGFTQTKPEMYEKSLTHTKVNMIYFDSSELKKHLKKYPRKYRHLFRFGKCSKNYLERVIDDPDCIVSEQLKIFAKGNFYLDEIIKIEEISLKEPEYVYDLSVVPSQSFVGGFGGILLHNTEAKALFEAMRIGALANVVAGTIHGESAYGVFDRVVNDLGVTKTSFKAIDVISISGMIKSGDGLHRFRRVIELTEVRKHWKDDPSEENGFVNLLEYSAKDDMLKPTDILLNGESHVINEIAKRVREWHGNWDAVWDNIELRAKIKQTMVDYAKKLNRKDILEAEWVSASNEMFHMISDQVKKEVGSLNSEEIFKRWDLWFKEGLRGRK